jgi:DNA adenine methylase
MTNLMPFLKWPGGKRWFVQNYSNYFPTTFNKYIEPFLGSGAVFFHLQPNKALLSDINPELINAYQGLKENRLSVVRSLLYHQRCHSASHYYKIRAAKPKKLYQEASRMIYLNRTCFNGIYRVNKQGNFNVPIGTRTKIILDTDNFELTSNLLRTATLSVSDFADSISSASTNDLVFADPPYTVRHNLNGFVKYNENLFSWNDQVRLAKALFRAKEQGAKIVATNANHDSVRKLYENQGFHFKTVSRYSSIAASAANRKLYEELVIFSHPNN